ncbi:hypothetical protein ASF45_32165 [Pseudorhodoferax sp. Leaf265]|nr:hypothetical protein ASF45_32165 [Pseudorhodoferax sp. Leaf265]
MTVLALLLLLKEQLPYDLRYETDIGTNKKSVKHTVGHVDQRSHVCDVPRSNMTLREILIECVIPALPEGWMVTIFPGRVILYKEPTRYRYGLEVIAR